MDSGFHDFSDPRKGLDELYERFKNWAESGTDGDLEDLFDAMAVTLMHLGIDNAVYDITVPYCAAMHALGEGVLADATYKVTMRIGKRNLAIAYGVRADKSPWPGIDEVPDETKDKMTQAIVFVLQGMGATVDRDARMITITGWDCDNPNHNHPTHTEGDTKVTMNIDKAVADFRKEIDRELGDTKDPSARWMTPREDNE